MDKKTFEKKLKAKRAKKGKEDETIEMITTGEIVKEAGEIERPKIITTGDIMGGRKSRGDNWPYTIITTSTAKDFRGQYLKDMEEQKKQGGSDEKD